MKPCGRIHLSTGAVYVRLAHPCGRKYSCRLRPQLRPRVLESVPDSVASDASDSEPVPDPAVLDEPSILDPPAAAEESDASNALTFHLLHDSTSKGRPKLVDSRGYSYNIKRRRPKAVDWQCTIRRNVLLKACSLLNGPV